jgi:hypothetical protein
VCGTAGRSLLPRWGSQFPVREFLAGKVCRKCVAHDFCLFVLPVCVGAVVPLETFTAIPFAVMR